MYKPNFIYIKYHMNTHDATSPQADLPGRGRSAAVPNRSTAVLKFLRFRG